MTTLYIGSCGGTEAMCFWELPEEATFQQVGGPVSRSDGAPGFTRGPTGELASLT